MKKLTVPMALALALLVAGTVLAAPKVIKLGHLAPENDPRHPALQTFAKIVEEKTGGQLKVQLFPNSQLGSERELIEQTKMGVTEMNHVAAALGNFFPKWTIFDMPYLFKDNASIQKFFHGPIGQKWVKEMEDSQGITILALYNRNPRNLLTKDRPVRKMEDLKGLKIRVPTINVYTDTWRAFGVQPVPIPTSEQYMSMKTGVIDGLENPVDVFWNFKLYETAKYISLTEHMRSVFFLIINTRFFESLTPQQQKILREAAAESQKVFQAANDKSEKELLEELKAKGMQIIKPDLSGFKKASQAVIRKYDDIIGKDVLDQVMAENQ